MAVATLYYDPPPLLDGRAVGPLQAMEIRIANIAYIIKPCAKGPRRRLHRGRSVGAREYKSLSQMATEGFIVDMFKHVNLEDSFLGLFWKLFCIF